MTITLSISNVNVQNLCPNSSSERDLSKTAWPRLGIPYGSKVIMETTTECHFSTHFDTDKGS